MSVIRLARAVVTPPQRRQHARRGHVVLRARRYRGTPCVDLLWKPVQEMKTAAVEAASSGGALQRSASVGGPRWILRDGILCSNREMFYAEAAVAA